MRPTELIAAGIIVLGWFATHLFSEARERRKEVRGQLDKFIERLAKLETNAVGFHSAAAFDAGKTAELRAEVDRLERLLGRLPIASLDEMVGLIVHHRRAITLRNFESSTFNSQIAGSDILIDVISSTRDIEDFLEERYLARYPARFPYIVLSTQALVKIGIAVIVVFGSLLLL